MRRQADDFAVYSRPQQGAAVLARVAGNGPPRRALARVVLGVVTATYPGETACGDAWSCVETRSGASLIVVDGSGHGPNAQIAAQAAVRTFEAHAEESGVRVMELVHRALLPTRGAAVSIAQVDTEQQVVRFVGVGNVVGALHSNEGLKRMISHGGIAGQVMPRMREFVYPYSGTPTVIMHSDGVSAKWDLTDYPGLAVSHPSLVAGTLFRDFARGRDDACVAVLRL
jgi:hypothetical protein